jgi:MFS transporter, Spinster family, sphingosine-1-phosphate transporter
MATFPAWVRSWTPRSLLWIFTLVNFVNYLDRGIVPGAYNSISAFITETTGNTKTDALLGILQSSFIIGYSVACVTFGHLVHKYPPFRLMTIGLILWVLACLLSGASPNFYVLVAARIISGAGEASFQTVVPPYIDSNSPTSQRGCVRLHLPCVNSTRGDYLLLPLLWVVL